MKQNRVLFSLYTLVHKIYSNSWLFNLSNKWQQLIDRSDGWYNGEFAQTNFFERVVNKYFRAKSNSKLFVIISDGFRYECGKILNDYLNEENRFISNLIIRLQIYLLILNLEWPLCYPTKTEFWRGFECNCRWHKQSGTE